MIVKVVIPDSIYARVYFARGEQGPQGPTGPTGSQGPSGIVNVDSPITNSGTSTAANIGINQALLSITPAQVTGTAVITTDPRLSDTRIPTDASVTDSKITGTGLSPNKITGTAVITTDSRLSDARTPLAHAATHGSAGSDPVTLAQSQITNLVSDLSAKAPKDSPVFTTKVTLPVTSGTFLGTNSLGEIYKVGGAPGLGYVPYTASVGGGIAWQNLATLVKTDAANAFTVGGHSITNNATGTVPLYIRAIASQTADLFQVQNSGGTNLINVTSAGNLNATGQVRVGTTAGIAQLGVISAGASTIGAVVRGAASQSANALEIQTSDGVSNTSMTVYGGITSRLSGSYPGVWSVGTGTASTIGLVVRGSASQSADLQQWQNSAGTVLARVTASGEIVVPSNAIRGNELFTFNYYGRLQEASSGARLSLVKMTAAAANPGAGIGSLYFRDGTNAGTLKLVVRAGAAGAETTILDNIPQ